MTKIQNILHVKDIEKTFVQSGRFAKVIRETKVLHGISLDLKAQEIVALVGPSGSGKSTLLQIAGLLEKPSSGHINIHGHNVSLMNDDQRTKIRCSHIGFVYQFHHLLPEFNALENVSLPQIINGKSKKEAQEKSADLLDRLGLSQRKDHRSAELSGGEQQRVAIARALANDPHILLADEPTGNLDLQTSEEVFALLLEQVKHRNIGALIATHNMDLADQMSRILELKSGRILPF